MKITFKLRNGFTILEFMLVNNQIKDLVIHHKALAHEILRNSQTSLTYSHLLRLFHYYLGGRETMEDYIEYIKKNGFFSPYQPNLDIEIYN